MTDRVRRALEEVSSAANAFLETTTDYEQLLATIVRSCAKVLHATCTVSLLDNAGQTITPVAMHDEDPSVIAAYPSLGKQVPVGDTTAALLTDTDLLFDP